jgi:uncharacterized damage-inducible protein DinB
MEIDLVLHLRYQAWATQLILDGVKALPPAEYERDRQSSHCSIKGTLEHMYVADTLWFSRVAGEPFAKISDIPKPDSLADLSLEWMSVLNRWQRWAQQLEPNQFGIEIGYTNTEGVAYRTPLWQVVLQVVTHSNYHRGQVVTMMRQAGAKPPNTDLILYYRALEKQAIPAT